MHTIDSRGKRCPQPIIDLAKEITLVEVGELVLLISDDPASTSDVQAWCRMTGHELVDQTGDQHTIRRAK